MDIIAYMEEMFNPTWMAVPILLTGHYAKYVLLAILIAFVICYIFREMVVKPVKETASIIGRHRKNVHNILATLSEEYCVFDNVAVNKGGSVIAADRVVISPYGVFVIQEEYYSGNISGSDCHRQWDIDLFGHHGKMRNPADNVCHRAKGLAKIIGIDESYVIPIVVFPDDTVLKTCTSIPVVNLRNLAEAITGFQETVFSDEDTQTLIDRLDVSMLIGEYSK